MSQNSLTQYQSKSLQKKIQIFQTQDSDIQIEQSYMPQIYTIQMEEELKNQKIIVTEEEETISFYFLAMRNLLMNDTYISYSQQSVLNQQHQFQQSENKKKLDQIWFLAQKIVNLCTEKYKIQNYDKYYLALNFDIANFYLGAFTQFWKQYIGEKSNNFLLQYKFGEKLININRKFNQNELFILSKPIYEFRQISIIYFLKNNESPQIIQELTENFMNYYLENDLTIQNLYLLEIQEQKKNFIEFCCLCINYDLYKSLFNSFNKIKQNLNANNYILDMKWNFYIKCFEFFQFEQQQQQQQLNNEQNYCDFNINQLILNIKKDTQTPINIQQLYSVSKNRLSLLIYRIIKLIWKIYEKSQYPDLHFCNEWYNLVIDHSINNINFFNNENGLHQLIYDIVIKILKKKKKILKYRQNNEKSNKIKTIPIKIETILEQLIKYLYSQSFIERSQNCQSILNTIYICLEINYTPDIQTMGQVLNTFLEYKHFIIYSDKIINIYVHCQQIQEFKFIIINKLIQNSQEIGLNQFLQILSLILNKYKSKYQKNRVTLSQLSQQFRFCLRIIITLFNFEFEKNIKIVESIDLIPQILLFNKYFDLNQSIKDAILSIKDNIDEGSLENILIFILQNSNNNNLNVDDIYDIIQCAFKIIAGYIQSIQKWKFKQMNQKNKKLYQFSSIQQIICTLMQKFFFQFSDTQIEGIYDSLLILSFGVQTIQELQMTCFIGNLEYFYNIEYIEILFSIIFESQTKEILKTKICLQLKDLLLYSIKFRLQFSIVLGKFIILLAIQQQNNDDQKKTYNMMMDIIEIVIKTQFSQNHLISISLLTLTNQHRSLIFNNIQTKRFQNNYKQFQHQFFNNPKIMNDNNRNPSNVNLYDFQNSIQSSINILQKLINLQEKNYNKKRKNFYLFKDFNSNLQCEIIHNIQQGFIIQFEVKFITQKSESLSPNISCFYSNINFDSQFQQFAVIEFIDKNFNHYLCQILINSNSVKLRLTEYNSKVQTIIYNKNIQQTQQTTQFKFIYQDSEFKIFIDDEQCINQNKYQIHQFQSINNIQLGQSIKLNTLQQQLSSCFELSEPTFKGKLFNFSILSLGEKQKILNLNFDLKQLIQKKIQSFNNNNIYIKAFEMISESNQSQILSQSLSHILIVNRSDLITLFIEKKIYKLIYLILMEITKDQSQDFTIQKNQLLQLLKRILLVNNKLLDLFIKDIELFKIILKIIRFDTIVDFIQELIQALQQNQQNLKIFKNIILFDFSIFQFQLTNNNQIENYFNQLYTNLISLKKLNFAFINNCNLQIIKSNEFQILIEQVLNKKMKNFAKCLNTLQYLVNFFEKMIFTAKSFEIFWKFFGQISQMFDEEFCYFIQIYNPSLLVIQQKKDPLFLKAIILSLQETSNINNYIYLCIFFQNLIFKYNKYTDDDQLKLLSWIISIYEINYKNQTTVDQNNIKSLLFSISQIIGNMHLFFINFISFLCLKNHLTKYLIQLVLQILSNIIVWDKLNPQESSSLEQYLDISKSMYIIYTNKSIQSWLLEYLYQKSRSILYNKEMMTRLSIIIDQNPELFSLLIEKVLQNCQKENKKVIILNCNLINLISILQIIGFPQTISQSVILTLNKAFEYFYKNNILQFIVKQKEVSKDKQSLINCLNKGVIILFAVIYSQLVQERKSIWELCQGIIQFSQTLKDILHKSSINDDTSFAKEIYSLFKLKIDKKNPILYILPQFLIENFSLDQDQEHLILYQQKIQICLQECFQISQVYLEKQKVTYDQQQILIKELITYMNKQPDYFKNSSLRKNERELEKKYIESIIDKINIPNIQNDKIPIVLQNDLLINYECEYQQLRSFYLNQSIHRNNEFQEDVRIILDKLINNNDNLQLQIKNIYQNYFDYNKCPILKLVLNDISEQEFKNIITSTNTTIKSQIYSYNNNNYDIEVNTINLTQSETAILKKTYNDYQLIINKCEIITLDPNDTQAYYLEYSSREGIIIEKSSQDFQRIYFLFSNQPTLKNELIKYIKKTEIKFYNDSLQIYKKEFTKQWIDGEISNFQYIKILNKVSGRNILDKENYYLFPWPFLVNNAQQIIQQPNYFSNNTYWSRSKLNNNNSFVLQNKTIQHFLSIDSMNLENMLYDLQTQGEAIPDLFQNSSLFKISQSQFPKWVRTNSVQEFIYIMRAELERKQISQNLHKWINYSFGNQLPNNKFHPKQVFHEPHDKKYAFYNYFEIQQWNITSKKCILDINEPIISFYFQTSQYIYVITKRGIIFQIDNKNLMVQLLAQKQIDQQNINMVDTQLKNLKKQQITYIDYNAQKNLDNSYYQNYIVETAKKSQPDNFLIVITGYDKGKFKLFSYKQLTIVNEGYTSSKEIISAVNFNHIRQTLLLGQQNGAIELWRINKQKMNIGQSHFQIINSHYSEIQSIETTSTIILSVDAQNYVHIHYYNGELINIIDLTQATEITSCIISETMNLYIFLDSNNTLFSYTFDGQEYLEPYQIMQNIECLMMLNPFNSQFFYATNSELFFNDIFLIKQEQQGNFISEQERQKKVYNFNFINLKVMKSFQSIDSDQYSNSLICYSAIAYYTLNELQVEFFCFGCQDGKIWLVYDENKVYNFYRSQLKQIGITRNN